MGFFLARPLVGPLLVAPMMSEADFVLVLIITVGILAAEVDILEVSKLTGGNGL